MFCETSDGYVQSPLKKFPDFCDDDDYQDRYNCWVKVNHEQVCKFYLTKCARMIFLPSYFGYLYQSFQ